MSIKSQQRLRPEEREAYALHESVQRLSRKVVDKSALVVYEFEFYIEDQTHGGVATGTRIIGCDAVVPLCQQTASTTRIHQGITFRKALGNSGAPTDLKCRLTVSLSGSANNKYGFESRRTTDIKDHNVTRYHFEVADNTCQPGVDAPVEPLWQVVVSSAHKAPLALESLTFTHDPIVHARLMELLLKEAVDARQQDSLLLLAAVGEQRAKPCKCHRCASERDDWARRERELLGDDDDGGGSLSDSDDEPGTKRARAAE